MKFLNQVFLLCSVPLALMGLENQVPSCYDRYNIEMQNNGYKKLVSVIVDQTTVQDKPLQEFVYKAIRKLQKPDTMVTVTTFSSYRPGRYTQTIFSGATEAPLEKKQRNATSKKVLRKFDQCLKDQDYYAHKKMAEALKQAFNESTNKLPNSDIYKNLYQINEGIIRNFPSREKVVLFVSDMIENSTISSFYSHGKLGQIDPEREFDTFSKSGLETDFANARIFVVGAGVTPKQRYNDPKKMRQLKAFWDKYFSHNHAKLVEFGEPMILGNVY